MQTRGAEETHKPPGTAGIHGVEAPSLTDWERDEWPKVDDDIRIEMLETMLRIRYFDRLAVDASKRNEAPGSVHPYVGQEAIAVGVCSVLQAQDFITSTHRGHGHSIARGADPYRMFAELLGRAEGYARGRGGSMHIADVAGGNLGTNGIAGGGPPIAVGSALASWSLRSCSSVSIAFFGDGASNEGSVHEAINFAAALKLPCIFICENNLYSISVAISTATAQSDIGKRAPGYGIPGYVVDGQDCLAVRTAAERAVAAARRGEGPSLIECKTYSYLGHSTFSQPQKPKEETSHWAERDPIEVYAQRCISEGLIGEDDFGRLTERVAQEIQESLDRARQAPPIHASAMLQDVWASGEPVQWGN